MNHTTTTTYIAFLRAINVGGHVVKMERLRELFRELDLSNVRTYIQSGNVFFETAETDRAALTGRIEQYLFAALGYEVGTMLRTIAEVEASLSLAPFQGQEVTEEMRLCVLFLADPVLTPAQELPLRSPKGDCEVVAVTGGEIFFVLHLTKGGFADPIPSLSKILALPKKLKATVRFFGTTKKNSAAAKGETL